MIPILTGHWLSADMIHPTWRQALTARFNGSEARAIVEVNWSLNATAASSALLFAHAHPSGRAGDQRLYLACREGRARAVRVWHGLQGCNLVRPVTHAGFHHVANHQAAGGCINSTTTRGEAKHLTFRDVRIRRLATSLPH